MIEFTDTERREIDRTWLEVGKDPRGEPTPEQFVAFLDSVSYGLKVKFLSNIIDKAHAGNRCLDFGHDAQNEYLRDTIDIYRRRFGYM